MDKSLKEFACCGNLVASGVRPKGHRSHYTVTNLGFQIQIPVVTVRNVRYGLFNTTRRGARRRRMALMLCRVAGTDKDEDIVVRAACSMPIFRTRDVI